MYPPGTGGGWRLSYRELDVEQLGAIYESLLEQMPQMAGETMFRLDLDRRELIVSATERTRLAHRRGETQETVYRPRRDEVTAKTRKMKTT